MPSLANANKQTQVIRALQRAGFARRSGGKHTIMAHPDGRYTAIPNHRQLKVNMLRAILKQCGLSVTEYLDLYAGKRK
ncbi:MAG: type II toxin-antitoxin system HicA family toxin [Gammaproteobacteria bacterium]